MVRIEDCRSNSSAGEIMEACANGAAGTCNRRAYWRDAEPRSNRVPCDGAHRVPRVFRAMTLAGTRPVNSNSAGLGNGACGLSRPLFELGCCCACLFAADSGHACRRPLGTEFGANAARRSRYFRGNRALLSGARHLLRGRLDRRARHRATPHRARDHRAGESRPSLLGWQDDLRRGVLQADNLPILLRLSAACAPDSNGTIRAGADSYAIAAETLEGRNEEPDPRSAIT